MKAVNLYLLTRQVAPEILSEYEYALSGRDKSIKCRTEEIEMINAIVDQFFLSSFCAARLPMSMTAGSTPLRSLRSEKNSIS